MLQQDQQSQPREPQGPGRQDRHGIDRYGKARHGAQERQAQEPGSAVQGQPQAPSKRLQKQFDQQLPHQRSGHGNGEIFHRYLRMIGSGRGILTVDRKKQDQL